MIQNTIDRMSTTSAVIKGFAATVFTAIGTLSFSGYCKLIMVIPIICFFVLDVYYLMLERRFRFLYEQVRLLKKDLDFSMIPPTYKEIVSLDPNSNVRLRECLKSNSIRLFYVPVLIASILLILFS